MLSWKVKMISLSLIIRVSGCLVLGLSLTQLFGQAKIDFKAVAKMKKPKARFAYACDEKNVYIIGGATSPWGDAGNSIEVYSLAGNLWTSLEFRSPLNKKDQPLAEFIPGLNKIISFHNPTESLDLTSLNVRSINHPMKLSKDMGSAVWQNKIHLFGGKWYDKNMMFDPETELVTTLEPIPNRRITWGKIVDGKLFIFGGFNKDPFIDRTYTDILCFDIQSNSWKSVGHLPHPITSCSITTDGERIFLLGRYGDAGFLGVYDPPSNEYYEYESTLPFIGGALIATGGKLLFFGGQTEGRYPVMNHFVLGVPLNEVMNEPASEKKSSLIGRAQVLNH
jgi:Kelch motif